MNSLFLPFHMPNKFTSIRTLRAAMFAVAAAVVFVVATNSAQAQFTFASDSSTNSAYSDGWTGGDNGGSGFNAWTLSSGAPSGNFAGNYTTGTVNNGVTGFTSGGAFMQYAKFDTDGVFAQADRSLSSAMGIGDTFSFQWGVNWDSGGAGNKGFNIYVGGTGGSQVINMNIGGSSTITLNGTDVLTGFGTSAMTINITRDSASQLTIWTAAGRDGGSGFTNTLTGLASSAVDAFRFYTSRQNDGDDRNNAFNNFSVTNSGVYSVTQTESRALTGGGALVVSNSSTLTLTSDGNTFTGGTTIQSGSTLSVGSGGGSGDLNGNVANSGTLTFNRTGTLSYSGVVSGAGSVTKSGNGQVNLSGASSYSGATTVSAGTLEVQNATALGNTTGDTTVENGAALKFYNAGTMTVAEALDITGTGLSDTGALFNVGGDNTLSGSITLSGNARINANTQGGSGSLTLSGAVGGGNNTLYVGALGATGEATTGGNVTISGGLSGAGNTQDGITTSLFKDGIGALTLSTANTHTGATLLAEGTILVGNNSAFGTGTVQLHWNTEDNLKVIASTDGNDRTFSNNLNVYNNFTLGAADRTGGITFQGTVELGEESGTRNITTASGTSHTFSGVVSGLRGITKLGDGSLTLSGTSANDYADPTIVSGGTLILNKTAGVNAIAGNITVNTGATLLISQSNQVANSSAVTLSGGTISRGSGVSEVFGNLNLTTGSFLDFGTGTTGTMSFGTYTPSSLLTVNNFGLGNTLTFGSDLTTDINNASLFSFDNGFTSSWDGGTSTFTITAIPEPSTYLAAAGLLAMFLWPVRRRLIKDAKSILGLRPTGRDRIEAYRNA